MDIKLKTLKLTNFKGIKDLEIEFKDGMNCICGDNATGKTTVFDSFLWLLFGKDSSDRKDFGVKTLDSNGNEIHRIEHNVTAVIEIDGKDRTFSRTLREKWSRKKGNTEEEYTGNDTVYEVDNVPLKMSEYQEKVADMVDESLFKLITNVGQFCSMKWQEQRSVLTAIANIGTDKEIAESRKMTLICEILNSGKSIEERAKELANSKKKIKKELDTIPVRIDEISRTFPENEMRNADDVKADIEHIKNNIKAIEKEIAVISKSDVSIQAEVEIKKIEAEMQTAIAEANAENSKMKAEYNEKLSIQKAKIRDIEEKIAYCKKTINDCNKDISNGETMLENLRVKYSEVYKRKFDDTVCPCCGRPWEAEDLQEKQNTFNQSKAEEMKSINVRGQELKAGVEYSKKLITEKEGKIIELTSMLESENGAIDLPKLITVDTSKFTERIEKIRNGITKPDTSKQEEEIKNLESKLAELEQELSDINSVAKQKQRIDELTAEIKEKSSAIAEIEKEEAEIMMFTEVKIELLGASINSKFKMVKFKLYNNLINGGYEECCEATVNGVPFKDLNNAAKINAGLDIINTLQNYHNVFAPVFIDNKESVNQLFDIKSQIVCLIVTNDKKLIVNREVA